MVSSDAICICCIQLMDNMQRLNNFWTKKLWYDNSITHHYHCINEVFVLVPKTFFFRETWLYKIWTRSWESLSLDVVCLTRSYVTALKSLTSVAEIMYRSAPIPSSNKIAFFLPNLMYPLVKHPLIFSCGFCKFYNNIYLFKYLSYFL